MVDKVLLDRVATARQDVTDAEEKLQKLLQEVQSAPRADKTMVSSAVEEAFAKLKEVKADLLELEVLLQKALDTKDLG